MKLNQRQFARISADMDGKFEGLTQAEAEKTLKLARLIDTAFRIARMPSPLVAMARKSKKDAEKFKAKKKRVTK